MVHGDCSSRGCYAMSDEQILEIFALGRESFFGGQKSFQVQAYPFRMTPANMAKHRNNPNIPFWRMLKEGYDHFEVTNSSPRSMSARGATCSMRRARAASSRSISVRARQCPVYEVPQEIASAVYNKQRNDELQFAQLASRGTPVAPIRSGRDGGMHPTFVAKLQPREIVDERGNIKLVVDRSNQGSIVAYNASRLKPTSRVQRARWSPSGPPACRCRRAAPQALAAERAIGRTELHGKARKFLPLRLYQARSCASTGGSRRATAASTEA